MRSFIIITTISIIILVLIFLFDTFLIDTFYIENKLFINEYMSSNNTIIQDNNYDYSDWIEIYNGSALPINLKGFGLSDDLNDPLKWQFPEININPDSYLIVFASGNDNDTEIDRALNKLIIHTDFKLGSNDIELLLSTNKGKIIDSVNLINLNADESYERIPDSSEWSVCTEPTPGFSNNAEGLKQFETEKNKTIPDIIISEIMASNKTTIIDDNGNFSDWIEIHNISNNRVNLKNYTLSDEANNLSKWDFPEIILEPDQYIIVFASGQDSDNKAQYLHTNFKLNSSVDNLFLCNPDKVILSRIIIKDHVEDISYGIDTEDSKWYFYNNSTPGYKNTSKEIPEEINSFFFDSDIIINEVMPNKSNVLYDEDYEQTDWIEIFNSGRKTIDLDNIYLSDSSSNPCKWEFPDISISPGQYLIVYASGKNRKGKYLHTNFKLDNNEEVILSSGAEKMIYKVAYKTIPEGISCSMSSKGILYYLNPSPGRKNNTGYSGISPDIDFSVNSGFYTNSIELSLLPSCKIQSRYTIRYTTDGSEPDRNSNIYDSKLLITESVVIRAKCYADNSLPGNTITNTYLIDSSHTLPVVSLSTDPRNLWDNDTGIYVAGSNASEEFPYKGANYWQKWEKPVHIEFFEADGAKGFSIDAGLKIFGAFSRAKPQKSFTIKIRESYGQDTLKYPLFPDRDTNIYKSFVLRTSGQDADFTRIRDSLMCALASEIGLDTQSYRPCVVYINGEYWGHYNIRDKLDKYFLAYNCGLTNPDNVDMIQGNSIINEGDYTAYSSLHSFASTHDLSIPENYRYIQTQMDINNYMDYQISQMYFANFDNGNIRFWREKTPGARWRWILFDTDWGFFSPGNNTISYCLDPKGTGYAKLFNNIIIRKLLENEDFKNRFVNRFIELLNSTFSQEHVIELINKMASAIEPEMPSQVNRWGGSVENWQKNIQLLRDFASLRPGIIYDHLISTFNLGNSDVPPLID